MSARLGARLAAAFAALPLLTAATVAPAQDDFVLAPQLEIVVLPREVLAIDARSGGQRAERLELGERLLYAKQRGRVGVAITDRRMLAVATGSAAWQEARYRSGESPPADVALGDRVALLLTSVRAIGFDGNSGNFVESVIGPQESVLDSRVGQNLAVVVTTRRALGVSAARGGFFEVKLRVGEQITDASALANLVTLRTSKRLLLFRGPSGSWEERRLPIR
ncbi:hypothetical protein KJ059_07880 [Myxococcota bacterium]|nr:hypothetical protein [Myxococcota bacterium]MCZ7618722.1 hypothetical protein [Myxococcota bacterium]